MGTVAVEVAVYVLFVYFILSCLAKTESFARASENKNFTSNSLFIQWLPNSFILFMDESKDFTVGFTVICENPSEEFSLTLASRRQFVMTVRNTQTTVILCKNATDVKIPPKNSTDVHVVLPDTTESSSGYGYITSARKGVVGNLTFTLYGEIIGRTLLDFQLQNPKTEKNNTLETDTFHVTVYKKLTLFDTIFRVFIYIFLVFTTLAFGCKLDLAVVKENLKKPIAPVIGFSCQYVLMPLIAFTIAILVTPESKAVSLGLFVSGCCPGGGVSNIYAYLLGGDLSLSITMTTISTVAAIGMMPLWIYTLGQMFISDEYGDRVNIPFKNILIALLILILPLFAGVFVKYKLPKVARILLKIITPVTVVTIILLISVGIYTNLYVFSLFSPKIILVGSLLPYIGYLLSGATSLILRQSWTKVKTITIETGIQNTGIAILLMFTAFPPPDGEIAAVAPIASGIMTPLPLFVITMFYLVYKRCNREKYTEVPTQADMNKNGNVIMDIVKGEWDIEKENSYCAHDQKDPITMKPTSP